MIAFHWQNIIQIILVLGFVQGLILIGNLLFSKQDNRQAKYFLAALIALIVLELGRSLWFLLKIPDRSIIHYFFLCLVFTFSPNFYLYIKSLTTNRQISRIEILKTHSCTWLALGFTGLFLLTYYLTTSNFIQYFEAIIKSSMIVVFWWFFRKSYEEFNFFKVNSHESDLFEMEKTMITKWLDIFVKVIFLNAIAWSISILLQVIYPHRTFYYIFIPIEIAYVIAIYWIGYAGFQRVKLVYLTEQRNTQVFYNSIEETEIENCLERLEKAMEIEKQYLDPELSLQKLAENLKLPYKIISAVLNQKLQLGFNEYINQYRVEEFKKRIIDPRNAHLNIAGVAFDSGFNSLATFQRAFKNITRITPKEFIKNPQNRI